MKHAKRASAKGSAARLSKQPQSPRPQIAGDGATCGRLSAPRNFQPLRREVYKMRSLLKMMAAEIAHLEDVKDGTPPLEVGFSDLAEDCGVSLCESFERMVERYKSAICDFEEASYQIDIAAALLQVMGSYHDAYHSGGGDCGMWRLAIRAGQTIRGQLDALF